MAAQSWPNACLVTDGAISGWRQRFAIKFNATLFVAGLILLFDIRNVTFNTVILSLFINLVGKRN